jgi:hypothetical protein
MSYLIINKKNMFIKFEFIAGLVEKGEIVFTYDEKAPKPPKKDELTEFDYGSKANPLREGKQYKTKWWYKDKEYAPKRSYSSDRTPAYKKSKFGPKKWNTTSTNKKWNTGLGYKARAK